ncbi:MAG: hypothetical protein AAB449_03410 [Patescibacteria group bacterium]
MNTLTKNRGFTIFFATLVSSLALAVGIAIFDLTIRELNLSQTATQSQYAIFAADAGTECALYWDYKCPVSGGPAYCALANGSIFATSSTGVGVPVGSNLNCNQTDITGAGALWTTAGPPGPTANAATTSFTLSFAAQGKPYCAKITVEKWGNPSQTRIISRGYNTCTAGWPLIVERSLQLSY